MLSVLICVVDVPPLSDAQHENCIQNYALLFRYVLIKSKLQDILYLIVHVLDGTVF